MGSEPPINVNATYIENDSHQKPKRRVNKVIFIVLALFLGDLGIHKFYIGQNFKGFMYLLFCWSCIPGLLSAISALRVLLFEPADSQGMICL